MFSKEFESALNAVAGWARVKRHEFITVEHLLLALIEEPVASEILLACDLPTEKLKEEVQQYLTAQMPLLTELSENPEVGDSARSVPCAVHRQTRSHWCECVGCYFQ